MVGAIRVQPGVEFKASIMGSFYPEVQRIVKRFRGLALFPRKELRPGFQVTVVKGVSLRPYLEDDCIEIVGF